MANYDRLNLPKEAVKINGVYLEDYITGYKTVTTTGRETLEKDIKVQERYYNGDIVQRTRYPSREITVEFVLQKDSMPNLRDAWNTLARMLAVENAQFIFNDEPDKYFVGTPKLNGSVTKALNSGVCSYTVYCADPFKYSLTEKSAALNNSAFTMLNNGYKCKPRFEVDFATDSSSAGSIGSNADCGFVQFISGQNSIQFGDDEEQDTSSVKVFARDFTKGKGSFADNNAVKIKDTFSYNGTSKIDGGLKLNSSASVSGKYHGVSVVYDISTALSGEFKLTYKHQLQGLAEECGAFYVGLFDASNNLIIAEGIEKKVTDKANAECYLYTQTNGWKKVSKSIKKSQTTSSYIERTLVDGSYNYSIKSRFRSGTVDIVTDATPVKKVVFFFGKYASKTALSKNTVKECTLVNGSFDAVNTFQSGDKLRVDMNDMSILLNDNEASNLGDITNNWLEMSLENGQNVWFVQYSSWVHPGYEPTFRAYWRERWL